MTSSAVLDGRQWVTDGGLETDLLFNRGIDLPEFASFPLLGESRGRSVLREYYSEYAAIAVAANAGLLLETPTWRANPDWAALLGFDRAALDRANHAAVELVREVGEQCDADVRISGVVGPRGDGYVASGSDADQAAEYHAGQLRSFAEAGVDLVHAMTMTAPGEAIGVVRGARANGLAVAISFTVETDGRLPDGRTLAEALDVVEQAAPADWYGVNCAHPQHVEAALDGGPWMDRLVFLRPNAPTMSHEELDAMEVLDSGDVSLLVSSFQGVLRQAPSLRVVGGCCGTDSSHVAALWGLRNATVSD